jgi:hypothetical protein
VTEPDASLTGPPETAAGWRPWLEWLRRWGISVASLVGGLLTLFVFRRELTHVRWVIGNLLLLWLLFAILTQVRQALEERGHRLVITAADYLTQTIYHAVLLFMIPVYYASTTLTSGNAVFLALMVSLAVLATFDPWYQALVEPLPWLNYVFFLVSIFGALNVALPLVGVPPHLSLVASAWMAVVALTPAVCRARRWSWSVGLSVMMIGGIAIAALAHVGRAWIPPAPLFLARTAIAWDVGSVESMEPTIGAIKASELRQRGLVAYTTIFAPAGLNQAVQHVWRRDAQVVDAVSLSPVRGGRREGFRTYSRKTAFPENPIGRWTVDVVTSSGQLIGRLRFRVIE